VIALNLRILREYPGEFASYGVIVATLVAGAAAVSWWAIPLAATVITLLRGNALRRRAKEVHQEWGGQFQFLAYAAIAVLGFLLHALLTALAFAAGRGLAILV
jgi:hypothetical protein